MGSDLRSSDSRPRDPRIVLDHVALVDALCGAADDLNFTLRRRDAQRLAERLVELLDAAGYTLTNQLAHPCENPSSSRRTQP